MQPIELPQCSMHIIWILLLNNKKWDWFAKFLGVSRIVFLCVCPTLTWVILQHCFQPWNRHKWSYDFRSARILLRKVTKTSRFPIPWLRPYALFIFKLVLTSNSSHHLDWLPFWVTLARQFPWSVFTSHINIF